MKGGFFVLWVEIGWKVLLPYFKIVDIICLFGGGAGT
jgi:hypothetical protein